MSKKKQKKAKLSPNGGELSTGLSTSNPHKRNYWALIVHYGNGAVTNRAIAALQSAAAAPEHIWVVDNGPNHFVAAPPAGASGRPGVRVIRPARNTGYGGGLNFGLGALLGSARKDDIVVCMNNDLIVEPHALTSLRQYIQTQQPPVGLIGIATQRSGQAVSGWGQVNMLTGRTALLPRQLPAHPARSRSAATIARLPYLHGALIAAPYHVWLQVRGWPEEYFLYWEDVGVSLNARRRGIPLYAIDRVLAQHAPAVPQHADNETYYLVRNGAAFLQREMFWPWRQYWRARNALRRLFHALRPGGQATVREALRDAAAGITGPRPARRSMT